METKMVFLFHLMILPVFISAADSFCSNGTLLQEFVCLPVNYWKMELPEEKVDVRVDVLIFDIPEVDSTESQITLDLILISVWDEKRVQFKDNLPQSWISLGVDSLSYLWKPSFHFKNLIKFEEKKMLEPLTGVAITAPDSKVHLWTSALMTIRCDMNFGPFPFDSQKCEIVVESNSHGADQLIITMNASLALKFIRPVQAFEVSIKETVEYGVEYYLPGSTTPGSRSGFILKLDRHAGPYTIMYLMPCGIMVTISWVSFFIPLSAIPGRVTLLVTVFLSLTTFFGTIMSRGPIDTGLSAMSTYVLVCMFFSACAMAEFAVTSFIRRRREHGEVDDILVLQGTRINYPARSPKAADDYSYNLDKWSCLIFIGLFTLFNLGYYSYFQFFIE